MTPVVGRTTGVKQLPCHTGGTVKLRGFEQKRFTTRASVFESPHRLLIPGNSRWGWQAFAEYALRPFSVKSF